MYLMLGILRLIILPCKAINIDRVGRFNAESEVDAASRGTHLEITITIIIVTLMKRETVRENFPTIAR